MSSPCTVKLDLFEGPLDLLLHLIKKNEVEITDIPIATITDQYLAMIEGLPELNLDNAGEYLVMAATLTFIKSRMLLPGVPGEDDELEEDPRSERSGTWQTIRMARRADKLSMWACTQPPYAGQVERWPSQFPAVA